MSDAMKILEQVIRQTSIRHGVLASNIANVDTPNYRAKDIKFGQVLESELGLAGTDPKHIKTAADGSTSGTTFQAEDTQPWADNNNVEMDLEVAKMTENAMLFQAGVTLLEKKVTMFKSALKTS
jgi:flagellar basal-body rod protein FlgB